jgi:hypothetical protein
MLRVKRQQRGRNDVAEVSRICRRRPLPSAAISRNSRRVGGASLQAPLCEAGRAAEGVGRGCALLEVSLIHHQKARFSAWVLDNSRNIQKISAFSRTFFGRVTLGAVNKYLFNKSPGRGSISAVSRYICCTAADLTQKISDGSLSRRRRRQSLFFRRFWHYCKFPRFGYNSRHRIFNLVSVPP